MADTKITALTALTAADPSTDVLPIVDTSDTTMAASGTTKKISINNILGASGTATLASATITGDLTVDTSTLKVDSANNRVGIGTASPTSELDILRPSGSGITSGISLRTTAGAGGDGSFIKWLSAGTNEKVAQIDGVLNGTDLGYLSFQCGNGADAMAEQYRIASTGLFTWYDGAGGTRMTLNSTGLGVGVSPAYKLDVAGSSAGVLRLVNINNSSTDPAAVTRLSLDSQGATWHLDNERTSGIFKITRNSTACLTIDNSGNVGIGVTPSAWPAASKAIDVDSYGANYAIAAATQVGISRNCYYNGTNWIYKLTTSAQRFEQDNGGGFKWFTAAAGTAGTAITFTQSMTLDASGNLLVGTTSSPLASRVSVGVTNAQPDAFVIRNSDATAGLYWRLAYVNSANTFHILNQGAVGVYLTDGATSWTGTSDERLKDIIEPINNAVAKVGSLRSVIGKFKNDSEGTRRSFLIAQDVQAVLPEAVDTTNADAFGVRYTEVIPLLVAAIKELTAEVNALKNA